MFCLTAVIKRQLSLLGVASFASHQQWWTGDALPEATVVRRELTGVPKIEVVGRSKEKVEEIFWEKAFTPGEGRAGPSAQEIATDVN